jgi:hypothetical protein
MLFKGRFKSFLVVLWLAGLPVTAFGQAAVAGSVRDTSNTPIQGVLVAASSDALIEGVRTAVTDAQGRYRIEALRPGSYTLIFRRDGLKPYLHEGLELTAGLTATVDATLAVGSLAETITVTGEMAPIDARSAGRHVALSGEIVRSIPTARSYNALLSLVPGVVTNTNDVVTGPATTSFPMHGGRTNEGRMLMDGLNIGSPPSGNSATSYVVDVGDAVEVTFTSAGASGESETAGLVMNVIPRSGGNTVRGSFFASASGPGLQSDNLTPALQQQGLTAAAPFEKLYDLSAAIGGPVIDDRLWYFVNGHVGGSSRQTSGVYYNLGAANPTAWLYTPDYGRPAYSDRTFENASGRVTWQVSPRNKIGAFWDAQFLCRTCTGATAGVSEPVRVSPEAVGVLGRRLGVAQLTWSSPVSNRLLFDAGFGGTYFGVGNFERRPNPTRDLVRVAEQCANGCAANGNIPGLVYRSQDFSNAYTGSYLWRAALSFISGAHTLKVGYQHTLMTDDRAWMTNTQNLTYRVENGVPNQLTQSISPWVNNSRVAWDGMYVQGQVTRARLTFQGAVRFDRARSWFPSQQEGPSRFLPSSIVIPETRGVDSYKDITPRLGLAYDVFGSGKSAIRTSLGKYLEGAGVSGIYANTNPSLRMPSTTSAFGTAGVTRAWTDANRNFVPDCNLSDPAAQDLRPSGGDACGAISNSDFGTSGLTNNFDPRILDGWGVRPSDWHWTVSWQQQIGARSAIEATYVRRWYHGFFVADNLSLEPSDLTPFSIVAPRDPRLPGGGGYLVDGLFDVLPGKFGQVDNYVADSKEYGAWSQTFNGIDVTGRVRVGKDVTFIGGTSTGQTVADNCAVRERLPELATTTIGTSTLGAGLMNSLVSPLSSYCRVAFGVLTQARGLVSYVVPRIDLQLAATFQSKPGAMLAANYAATSADAAPSLGRNLSGNAANVTINLVKPGEMYGDRINQLDFRVAKVVKAGRSRTTISVDFYNALNSSAVLTYNTAFVPGGTWLQPTSILTPRLIRIGADVNF